MKTTLKWLLLTLTILALWLVFAPPRFVLNLIKRVDLNDPAGGAQVVEKYEFRKCHRIAGSGGLIAPDLAEVTRRHDELTLRLWLRNPKAVKGNTAMPNYKLSDAEIEAIVQDLSSLD